jgi:chromate transporter
MTDQPATDGHPSLREATAVWLRIGLLSFGGPAGQIALMHRELVEQRRWISDARFLHALNFCMLLPGPEAQQLATYIGWLLHGARGGLIAGTLFVLPGFLVILSLSVAYVLFQDTEWLAGLFFGLKAAILAVVIEALIRVGRRALKTGAMRLIAAAAFVALFVFAVPFPAVVLGAGLIGFAGARIAPNHFGAGRAAGPEIDASAVGRMAATARPTLRRAAGLIVIFGALWAAPGVALVFLAGEGSVFGPIAVFFSKMAVVTFGGAYAVLAYVAQQAVQTYGWLSPGDMLDGLAMAETTPGPLILVLTFVGFLAAHGSPGGLSPLAAGVIGAALTTWVTFVPCFLWIFLGAPYVERLRGQRALSSALSAITAAVVGVILNLALWFGLHVLFREVGTLEIGPARPAWPVFGTLDPWALVLTLAAILALFRLELGMLRTLALCGMAGLVASLVG